MSDIAGGELDEILADLRDFYSNLDDNPVYMLANYGSDYPIIDKLQETKTAVTQWADRRAEKLVVELENLKKSRPKSGPKRNGNAEGIRKAYNRGVSDAIAVLTATKEVKPTAPTEQIGEE